MGKFAVLILAFVGPVFLFPTLHRAHPYYGMENGIFLIVALAAIVSILPGRLPVILLAAIMALDFASYEARYRGLPGDSGGFQMGRYLAAHTKPDDVLVIYGMEWHPIVPYYAGRRAIMETTLAPLSTALGRPLVSGFVRDPNYHIGAIIRCPCKWDGNPSYEAMMTRAGLPRSNSCEVKFPPT